MDFNLPEEIQILKDTVRRFVDKELIPLEHEYRHDSETAMPEHLLKPLQEKTKAMGLWMLDVPAEYGGAGLGLLPRCVIHEEIARAVDLKSSGVVLERQWPTMMGEAPWQILFDNVRVPRANVIGPIGGGFSLAQKWIGEGRIRGHGARPVGIARRALDMMIEYSKVRVTFGRPLADRQAIQFMIADSAMELHAVRNMVYECAWRVDRGEEVRDLSYMVKVMATEMRSEER